MTLKALVVGLGQIGMGYDLGAAPQDRISTLARAFAEHDEFELVAGVDPSLSRRESFSAHYHKPAFSNLAAALGGLAPSVVAIAVPTEAHYPVLLEVLKASSIKAILCEKPLSYDLADAVKMVELTDRAGVSLYTNYMRRCDRAVVEVRRRLLNGEIEGPVKGVCWYSKGLFNNGSHFLNLLQFWLGEVINFEIIDNGRAWAGKDPEPELKIKFELGQIYFHAAFEENFSHYGLELIASNGRLRYEHGLMQWQSVIVDQNHAGYRVLNTDRETIESDVPFLQLSVVDQIAKEMNGEETSICTGTQGLETMQILAQIQRKL